ncbi:MAG: NAD(P)H-dependent oxidoreductase subunit E [Acidimicrobiia bacterium]
MSAGFDPGEILARYPHPSSAILPLLHAVQERDGYCSPDGIAEVARLVGRSAAEVFGVCSFYTMFKREPFGRLVVSVCTSVSCLRGGPELFEHLEHRYADDAEILVEEVECLAACDRVPVMQVNYEYHQGPSHEEAERLVEAYRSGELAARGPSGQRAGGLAQDLSPASAGTAAP